jgi:hypothetical protein
MKMNGEKMTISVSHCFAAMATEYTPAMGFIVTIAKGDAAGAHAEATCAVPTYHLPSPQQLARIIADWCSRQPEEQS